MSEQTSSIKSGVSPLSDSLSLEYWVKRWDDNNTLWHQHDGNKLLWRSLHNLLPSKFPSRKPAELTVFVPLCGKAKDMYLLYEMGFTVVGVEYSPKGVDEFFAENQLKEGKKNNGSMRSTEDGRLMIGVGDLFSFSGDQSHYNPLPYEKFDIIWDRGSFEATNSCDRERYASLLLSLLDKDGVYLMNTKVYDLNEYGGPPLAANTDDLRQFYGEKLDVVLLEKEDIIDSLETWRKRGLTKLDEVVHLMTFKS